MEHDNSNLPRARQMQDHYDTPRLVVRRPRPEDAADLWNNYTRDPEVTRYLIWCPHQDFGQTQAWVDYIANPDHEPQTSRYLLWHRATGQVIGGADIRFDGESSATFGYVLARAWWGQGLMTEAMTPLIQAVLALPGLHRIWAAHDVDNPASGRVMAKLGLEREGVARRFSLHPNVSDLPRDCVIWARVQP